MQNLNKTEAIRNWSPLSCFGDAVFVVYCEDYPNITSIKLPALSGTFKVRMVAHSHHDFTAEIALFGAHEQVVEAVGGLGNQHSHILLIAIVVD